MYYTDDDLIDLCCTDLIRTRSIENEIALFLQTKPVENQRALLTALISNVHLPIEMFETVIKQKCTSNQMEELVSILSQSAILNADITELSRCRELFDRDEIIQITIESLGQKQN